MGIGDKIENAKDQLVGKAKDAVGDAKNDPDLQAEGKAQESKGDVKAAGENIKDAFKN